MTPLRQRMVDDMQLRNLAASTQRQYIAYVAAFAKYFGKSPEELDIEAVRQYQLYLLNERKLSAESVNQYLSAVQFLYLTTLEMPWTSEYFPRARRPHKLPVVLSQEEVLAFFDHIPSLKYRAALMVCYGAGLRISEAVALKVSDIDSQRAAPHRARQRAQGPLRHALTASPRGTAPLLACYPSPRLPVPFLAQRASPEPDFVANGLPRSRPAPTSPSGSPSTPCATVSPLTCWRTAPISASSRCCSATVESIPPPVTPRCRRRW